MRARGLEGMYTGCSDGNLVIRLSLGRDVDGEGGNLLDEDIIEESADRGNTPHQHASQSTQKKGKDRVQSLDTARRLARVTI
jgi:hypothetical protein